MKKLISFYKDGFIESSDYEHFWCKPEQKTWDFLKQIEADFFDSLKIVQINYDAFEDSSLADQAKIEMANSNSKISHYSSPKAQVYILRSWKPFEFSNDREFAHPESYSKFSKIDVVAPQFSPQIEKLEFINKVNQIKSDIACGRFYQVNLTSYFKANFHSHDDINLFNFYQNRFQSKYSALLPSENFTLYCFSPELFLRKTGHLIVSEPIKGTGQDYQELFKSKKEEAELSMIVDLIRNDLHEISSEPTMVTEHRAEMKLPYAVHTYSRIETKTNKNLPEILQRMCPGGSISGCPKSEAVKSIRELEDFNRHFYTGNIGWWKADDFELNITIRSILQTKDQLYYYTGCGIVYDSDPESEWNELLKKASALS